MSGNQGALLFKEKQTKVLLAMLDKAQEWNTTSLARAAGATYVHTSKFLTRCEKMGLVQVTKHGKIKALTLSPKGIEVTEGIAKIVEKMAAKLEEAPKTVPDEK
ncbi:MAG: hypothetical protein KGH71_02615 [Candidatus Micrarchaeota archaeon]|nr:hypothetical protein [Candidatus Micrarchaeota archaeon]